MEIRKDLKSVSEYLERLETYANTFHKFNTGDWSHLKNQEDFDRVYRLKNEDQNPLLKIYCDGRDLAVYMSQHLIEWNYAEEHPTLTSYINSFSGGWLSQIDQLKKVSEEAKRKVKEINCSLWSVQQMIALFDRQITLLNSVQQTLDILKKTKLYKIENGEPLMDSTGKGDTNINISNVSGKVNVNSTDNSTNYSLGNTETLFSDIHKSIESSGIDTDEIKLLLEKLSEMQQAVNTKSFSAKYKEFMQLAATHVSIIAPFIPALTSLL